MHGYAEGMRLRRPSRFAQLKEPRRTIELVCFMHYTLFEHTDLLVKLIDRQVSRIWSRASKEAKSVTGSTAPADAFVACVREVLSRDTLDADEKIIEIATVLATFDATKGRRNVAARQRQILLGQISQIRPLVEILLDLDLCADSTDWWPPLLKAWRHAYRCPWVALALQVLNDAGLVRYGLKDNGIRNELVRDHRLLLIDLAVRAQHAVAAEIKMVGEVMIMLSLVRLMRHGPPKIIILDPAQQVQRSQHAPEFTKRTEKLVSPTVAIVGILNEKLNGEFHGAILHRIPTRVCKAPD